MTADELVAWCAVLGTRLNQRSETAVIPPKSIRKTQRDYDKETYKARHLIVNFFCKLKQFRAIATRYDKTARNFLAAITSQPLSFGSIEDTP